MNHPKIDRFTVILSLVLVVCAGLLIFTFRGIFNAISISYDLSESNADAVTLDESQLEEAKNFAFGQRTIVPLNIKPNVVPISSVTPTPKPTGKL